MARNGTVDMSNLLIGEVFYTAAGTSRVVATKGQYKVTIEKSGKFPDDFNIREGGNFDIRLDYDPK